jgi:hypothetical protein
MLSRIALCIIILTLALHARAQGTNPPGDPDIPDGPVTGIESEPAITATLYPNPCRDKISIDYHTRTHAPLQILIYTLDGKLVSQLEQKLVAGQCEIDLQNGKYANDLIILIRSGDQQLSYKVLKTD